MCAMLRLERTLLLLLLCLAGIQAKSEECLQCEFVVDVLHEEFEGNSTEEEIVKIAEFVCIEFKIEDSFVCDNIIGDFSDEVIYILGQIIVEPHQICGLLLSDCGTFFDPFNATWSIAIPPNQPTPVPQQPVQPGKPTLRVLHLTDVHMDTQYTPGLEAQCGEPQCCRPYEDPTEVDATQNITQPAGKWGTVAACDTPYWTLTNMLDFISSTHKDLDYVVVSGDLMSHAVYEYTKDIHAAMVKNISTTIRNAFPTTPVYFAVGNHEGVPIDNRASYMVKLWSGLRILSINNPLGGDPINMWMYINQTDPDGTLSWIVEQLLDAEKAGDKVHIVAHIPGGDGEALEGWAINYYNVYNRFQNTITGQFFGHTHSDEFYIIYENSSDPTSRPTGMVYSAPSVTTYSEYQPAYRIYTIDGKYPGSTYQVIDYEQWFLNLTEANASPGTPQWKPLFSSVNQFYGLSSQIPTEWNNMVNKMKTDDSLFQKYWFAFPTTPVYFAVGNHEGVPIDNFTPHFAPEQYHMDWLYDAMAEAWQGWVPQDQVATVKYRACYVVKMWKGLRIMSINNPLGGDHINFWMYMNQTDPDGTLSWVVDQLLDAEKAGDKVHVVAHIPGGSGEALEGWSLNYYKVFNRFQNTITAQFFGHTHSDQFYIIYEDPTDPTSRVTGMVYSAPSVTPYTEYNPAYRIYSIDGNYPGSTYQVIDYEEWYLNLTEANASPATPQWKQLFSSVNQLYGLSAHIPTEWNNLVNRMKTDDNLFQTYWQTHARRNQYEGLRSCTGGCKADALCTMRQFHHDSKDLCSDITGAENFKPRKALYKKGRRFTLPNHLHLIDSLKKFKEAIRAGKQK